MTHLHVRIPWGNEHTRADSENLLIPVVPAPGGMWVVSGLSHSAFTPGDVVREQDGWISELIKQSPLWRVSLRMKSPEVATAFATVLSDEIAHLAVEHTFIDLCTSDMSRLQQLVEAADPAVLSHVIIRHPWGPVTLMDILTSITPLSTPTDEDLASAEHAAKFQEFRDAVKLSESDPSMLRFLLDGDVPDAWKD